MALIDNLSYVMIYFCFKM